MSYPVEIPLAAREIDERWPPCCVPCGACLQELEGKLLPCATCCAGPRYHIMLERRFGNAGFYEPDVSPSEVSFREIVLYKKIYFDPHFPDRRAAFWWTDA